MASTTSKQLIGQFVAALAAKQSTPGGGAAAAVGAAVGAGAAAMSARYTQRKKDKESGAAKKADALISSMNLEELIDLADADAAAYADLQRTWKEEMPPEEKAAIEARALAVPVSLVETCHKYILGVDSFLPSCNPNITSDAKVGIHQLAGAARAAYQTALVNSPPADEKERLRGLLKEIHTIEAKLLELD
mmetsp:Transcript_38614/g.57942  ORF Transcript_38614/g.57942 Transcript_38614/m.57942 type:complete len:191 (-) Transcript_38614:474-1046(-)